MTRVCARGENEVVIVDLWEAEEDLRSMQENPEFLGGTKPNASSTTQ